MTNASISATNTRDLQTGVLNCVGLCLYDHYFDKYNKLCCIMTRVCSMTNVLISATNTKHFIGFDSSFQFL